MYYLNAFNEMLRKRQSQNNMMGGGQDQGVGTAAPSGPMGLGPAQDRNAFRDFYTGMSPLGRTAMGMMPVIGPAFNVGRLVDSGISAYQSSQLAPSRDARERSQDQFRAFEIAGMNAPMQNTAQQSFRAGEIADSRSLNTPQQSFRAGELADSRSLNTPQESFRAGEITANRAAPEYTDYSDVFTDRTSTAVPGFVAPLSTFDTTPFGGDAAAAGPGAGFGGGVGTGAFGGSPADAADMGYAHGGMVHAEHLKGRAPAPDDGYGALQGGEYVITKAAVEKYGKRLLDAINNGTFR